MTTPADIFPADMNQIQAFVKTLSFSDLKEAATAAKKLRRDKGRAYFAECQKFGFDIGPVEVNTAKAAYDRGRVAQWAVCREGMARGLPEIAALAF